MLVGVVAEAEVSAAAAVEGLTGTAADQMQQSYVNPLHPVQEIDH